MPLSRMFAASVALVALVGCGQRQAVHLASTGTADAPGAITQAATEVSEPSPPPAPPASPARAAVAPVGGESELAATQATAVETTAAERLTRRNKQSSTSGGAALERTDRDDPGAALWGRSFASVSVEVAGRPRPPVEDTELYVMPFHERGERGIRYSAGCNTGAASLRITADRLRVADDGHMSAAACSDPIMEQEDWFVRFIHTSPAWNLFDDGTRLRLTSGDTVVTFVEKAWQPWTDSP